MGKKFDTVSTRAANDKKPQLLSIVGNKKIKACILDADEVPDPVDDLISLTATKPGAPFTPGALQLLGALKKENRADYEDVRARLKEAGCRVTELDKTLGGDSTGVRDQTDADILIALSAPAAIFHAPDGTAYADIEIKGHRETWPIRSKGFRRWLARRDKQVTIIARERAQWSGVRIDDVAQYV